MHVFEMIVWIVVVSMTGSVVITYLKTRQTNDNDKSFKDIERRIDRLETMEQRIQALEAIVTDRKESLRREFDALS